MFRKIREIPPAPREVRWPAVLWYRWPIAVAGFVLAVYGGVFTLMLYFAAVGGDDAGFDGNSPTAIAEITDVAPVGAARRGIDQVSYRFRDANGVVQEGTSYADEGVYTVSDHETVQYQEGRPIVNRLSGTQLSLLPGWVEPSLFLGLLVLPGVLALGLWFQGVFDLKRMMSTGDVGVAEVLEVRKLRVVVPGTLAVCYRFRDHRAILRVGRHWVRARSALGEHLASGPGYMPVLHHRRWPQFSRLALVQDFKKSESPTQAFPGEVRPRT